MKKSAETMKSSQPATIHFMRFSVLTGIRAIENMHVAPNEGTNSE